MSNLALINDAAKSALSLKNSLSSPFTILSLLAAALKLIKLIMRARKENIEPRENKEFDLELVGVWRDFTRLITELGMEKQLEKLEELEEQINDLERFWNG